MSALLTEAEIQALPAEIRQHYKEHSHLRSLDDLIYFPMARRESFERLTARGAVRTIERIRQLEGDAAAAEAANGVAAARADRDRRVAEITPRFVTRRHVRLTTTWFASLSEELPEHRTAIRPSRWDFTARELPGILERVAEQWETLVEFIPGRLEYRDLDGTSDLGLAYRTECLLTQSGIVEVMGVEVDTAPPWIADEFVTDL